jgi:putative hydrolase of the HAD superfamily
VEFTTVLFDLDATLYDPATGLWAEIADRIQEYLRIFLKLPEDEVAYTRDHLYRTHGTTLRGLMNEYQIDPHEYLAFVHDIDAKKYLDPEPELRGMIESLPQKKWIFTNSDAVHTHRVLDALGLSGIFDGIITIESTDFICKPHPDVYPLALKLAGETNPRATVFLDDSVSNIEAASQMGIYSILVRNETPHPAARHTIESPLGLKSVMPNLWNGEKPWIQKPS